MATIQERTPPVPSPGSLDRLRAFLGRPVDAAGLAYFRVAFGAIMFWEMWRFLDPAHGWVESYYTGKDFYFAYWPFTFVVPLPEPWIYLAFIGTMVVAAMFAAGLFYRVAAPLLFVGLAYIFLLDKARYLNHFYLIVLLAFLMIWLPAHRCFSLDARRTPSLRSDTVPAWPVYLLMFQVGVPYFFGGVAKLNADWLQGEPLRAWLAARTDFPVIGGLFEAEPVVWAMTYGALFLDLFVVFFLLNRKTRVFAYAAALSFHLMNSRLFGIGVFPWTMIAATAIFFDPAWPRRIWADLQERKHRPAIRLAGLYGGAAAGFWLGGFLPETLSLWRAGIGALGGAIVGYHLAEQFFQPRGSEIPARELRKRDKHRRKHQAATPAPARYAVATPVVVLLAAWVAIQVLVPLRHFVVPGDVHWTEEGHNYAWHMKLRDKDADADFTVIADGEEYVIDEDELLSDRQERKMESRPHMMVQFAHHLEDLFEDQGYQEVEVYADAVASLNGRDYQQFIDPTFDLSSQRYPWIGHREWILPLETPLRRGGQLSSGEPELND